MAETYFLSGAFYGFLAVLCLYSATVFAVTRDGIYGWFALHTGTALLAFAVYDWGGGRGLTGPATFLAILAFFGFGLASWREKMFLWPGGGLILLYAALAPLAHWPAFLPLSLGLLMEAFLSAILLGGHLNRVSVERITLEEKLEQMQLEMERAESIHKTLLPAELPRRPDFSVHVLYHPMSRLGGDLYATEQIAADRFLILLADVSGHGLPAALDSALVRAAFARARRHTDRPAEVLREMSLFLAPHLSYRFVSAVCVLVDLENRRVSLSRAGHPYPIFMNSQETTLIRPGGPLLGMRDMIDFEESELGWQDGARLLLYTDGLSERRPGQKIPLLEVCRQSRSLTAKELGKELLADPGDLQGLEDDVTVVCLSFGSWALE
ncbi:MAG: SpoIIE family protein phosphatase [Spirochaetales bacterium]|nr:SpoIIE family protein phosphatase [Spirochaetales bacterium]